MVESAQGCGTKIFGTRSLRTRAVLRQRRCDERTQNHEQIYELASILTVDPTSEIEADCFLLSAPILRPTDVLFRANQTTQESAIDITAAALDAGVASDDCAKSSKHDKLREYQDLIPALPYQDNRYFPAVFTCVATLMSTASSRNQPTTQPSARYGFQRHASVLETTLACGHPAAADLLAPRAWPRRLCAASVGPADACRVPLLLVRGEMPHAASLLSFLFSSLVASSRPCCAPSHA